MTVEQPRPDETRRSLLLRLRARRALRVAASYAVIAWLLLQIASVVFDPLGVPKGAMTVLIILAVAGFPAAVALAWLLPGPRGNIDPDSPADSAIRPVTGSLRHYADAVVIAILLLTVVILALRESDLGRPKPPANPAIAVLPFENRGADPEQEYFSDGLADEMLDRLGRVPGLIVIARASSFSFKGKHADLKTIADRLGATTLLLGSVQRSGDRMRLSAQLVDGTTGREIWSGSYDRPLRDLLDVQEQLARTIADEVVPHEGKRLADATRFPVTDMSAYDLYLLGRQAQEVRWGNRVREAVQYLEESVARDPSLARAHAALARALVLWMYYEFEPAPADAMQRAETEAHRALALDSTSAEAHAAMGKVLHARGDTAGAEREFRRALEINPSQAGALYDYAVLQGNDLGHERESRALLARLGRIDPRSAVVWRSRVEEAVDGPDAARQVPKQVQVAIKVLADDVDALRMVQLAARSAGYAPEAYRTCLAIRRAGDEQAATLLAIRTWMLVDDFARASDAAAKLIQIGSDDSKGVAAYMAGEIAGLQGRYEMTSKYFMDARMMHTIDAARIDASLAFWLAVQGRYAEASALLSKLNPLPEFAVGGLGTALLSRGQLLPAVLRTYRATGRAAQADALVAKYLAVLRQSTSSDITDGGLDLAALDANEGMKDEAVAVLRRLFEHRPLVDHFHPELPWFKALEGYPPYDRLMAERKRRADSARAEVLRMDAAT